MAEQFHVLREPTYATTKGAIEDILPEYTYTPGVPSPMYPLRQALAALKEKQLYLSAQYSDVVVSAVKAPFQRDKGEKGRRFIFITSTPTRGMQAGAAGWVALQVGVFNKNAWNFLGLPVVVQVRRQQREAAPYGIVTEGDAHVAGLVMEDKHIGYPTIDFLSRTESFTLHPVPVESQEKFLEMVEVTSRPKRRSNNPS